MLPFALRDAVGKSVPQVIAIHAAFDASACVCVCLRTCFPARTRRRSRATIGGGSTNRASAE